MVLVGNFLEKSLSILVEMVFMHHGKLLVTKGLFMLQIKMV